MLGVIWPGEPDRLDHLIWLVLVIRWFAVTGPASVPLTVSVIVRVEGTSGRSKPVPVVVSVLPAKAKLAAVTTPEVSTTLVSDGLAIDAGITSRSVTPKASVSLDDDCRTTIV